MFFDLFSITITCKNHKKGCTNKIILGLSNPLYFLTLGQKTSRVLCNKAAARTKIRVDFTRQGLEPG